MVLRSLSVHRREGGPYFNPSLGSPNTKCEQNMLHSPCSYSISRLYLIRKPKLHAVSQNSAFCDYHTNWTVSILTSVACLAAVGLWWRWTSCTWLLPTMCLPVIDVLWKLKVLIRLLIINNCWEEEGKPPWDGLATTIKVSVTSWGSLKALCP